MNAFGNRLKILKSWLDQYGDFLLIGGMNLLGYACAYGIGFFARAGEGANLLDMLALVCFVATLLAYIILRLAAERITEGGA